MRGPFLQGMKAYHNHSQFITCGVWGSMHQMDNGMGACALPPKTQVEPHKNISNVI